MSHHSFTAAAQRVHENDTDQMKDKSDAGGCTTMACDPVLRCTVVKPSSSQTRTDESVDE